MGETDEDDSAVPPEEVAYHEAGHAVISHMLGYEVEHVSIAEAEDSRGRVWHAPIPDEMRQYIEVADVLDMQYEPWLMMHAIVSMAGFAAQRRYFPGADEYAATSDREHWRELALFACDDGDEVNLWEQRLQIRTASLVEKLWPQIERVAHALLERQDLDASGFLDALRGDENIGVELDLPDPASLPDVVTVVAGELPCNRHTYYIDTDAGLGGFVMEQIMDQLRVGKTEGTVHGGHVTYSWSVRKRDGEGARA